MDEHPDERSEQNEGASRKAEKQRTLRFIGSFSHSLDTKGRLVIPQTVREKLGEQFCVAPSYDFKSIAVYPTEMWEKRNEAYEKLGKLNPDDGQVLLEGDIVSIEYEQPEPERRS